MNGPEHRYVGSPMHDRLIGALEACSRQREMLRIQNRHVDWGQHQIAIPGNHAKDAENRRIPFDPKGCLAGSQAARRTLRTQGDSGALEERTFAPRAATDCQSFVSRTFERWRARQDSNLRPPA